MFNEAYFPSQFTPLISISNQIHNYTERASSSSQRTVIRLDGRTGTPPAVGSAGLATGEIEGCRNQAWRSTPRSLGIGL